MDHQPFTIIAHDQPLSTIMNHTICLLLAQAKDSCPTLRQQRILATFVGHKNENVCMGNQWFLIRFHFLMTCPFEVYCCSFSEINTLRKWSGSHSIFTYPLCLCACVVVSKYIYACIPVQHARLCVPRTFLHQETVAENSTRAAVKSLTDGLAVEFGRGWWQECPKKESITK